MEKKYITQSNPSSLYLLLASLIVLASCAGNRFRYLQDCEPCQEAYRKNAPVYHIQPDDLLYVNFTSMLQESVDFFNKSNTQNMNTNRGGGQDMNYEWIGYRVSPKGFIELPVIGPLKVQGLTLEEVKTLAGQKAQEYMEDAQAEVRLLNFEVEMVGEFNSPGKVRTTQNQLSVMEAINMAGGLATSGRWQKVNVIRDTPDSTITYEIDLTDKNLLASEHYWLQPNDIVYVEPRNMPIVRTNLTDFTFILGSVASTVTLIYLLIRN